jgi:hypothetical protein
MSPLAPASGSRIAAVLALQTASYGGSAVTAVGDYLIDGVRWHGPPEVTVTVHALQWTEGPADLPSAYHGAGSAAGVLLGDLTAATDVAIPLAPVTQGDVTTHAVAPLGYQPAVDVYLVYDDGAWISIGWDPTAEVTFAAPDLADARVAVRARAVLNGTTTSAVVGGVSPGDDVTLTLPMPPEQLAPADGAVDVAAGTVFSWRPAASIHILGMIAIADGPWIAVITADASAALPDLAPYGMSPPAGASYGWSVSAWGPATSADEITDPGAVGLGLWRGIGTSTEANSRSRVFITE